MNNASCNHGDVPVSKEFRWVVIGKIDFADFLGIGKVSILREEEVSGSAVKSNPALAVQRDVSVLELGISACGCWLRSCFCLGVRHHFGIEFEFVVAFLA